MFAYFCYVDCLFVLLSFLLTGPKPGMYCCLPRPCSDSTCQLHRSFLSCSGIPGRRPHDLTRGFSTRGFWADLKSSIYGLSRTRLARNHFEPTGRFVDHRLETVSGQSGPAGLQKYKISARPQNRVLNENPSVEGPATGGAAPRPWGAGSPQKRAVIKT